MDQNRPTPIKGSAWTAIAVLGFALVGALKRPAGSLQPTGGLPAAAQGTGNTASSGSTSRPGASDKPTQHPPGVMGIGRAVFDRFGRDNISLVAAGVAFYVMLSIFPALAAMVSLYALVGNPDDVASRISEYGNLLPPEALKLITDGLHNFAKTAGSTLSTALVTSVILALWTARAGMSSVMTGLNIAYEETEQRSFIVQVVVALAMTVGAVILAVFVIVAIAVIPIVLKFLYLNSISAMLINLARWPILAILVVVGFAVTYRYGPSRRRPNWRWISWGSVVATVLWMVGSFGFSIYVSKFGSYDATYGTLGAVVVLLLWLWVSALVLLVGAEIDAELDQRATATGSPLGAVASGAAPRP